MYIDSDLGLMQFFPWDADYDLNPPVASIFEARMSLARKLYNIRYTRGQFRARASALRTQLANAPPSVDRRQIPHPCDLYEPLGGRSDVPGPWH